MIERKKKEVAEEKRGFRSDRGCIDQIFVLKQSVEKNREKREELYVAFMDLEKVYDKACREIHECGVDCY